MNLPRRRPCHTFPLLWARTGNQTSQRGFPVAAVGPHLFQFQERLEGYFTAFSFPVSPNKKQFAAIRFLSPLHNLNGGGMVNICSKRYGMNFLPIHSIMLASSLRCPL